MLSRCPILRTCAIVLLAAALPTSAQQPGEKKAVPDATALGKAEASVTSLFATQLKKARTEKAAALALAAELLAQGKDIKDDDAVQFMALKMAGELAARAGDTAAALDAVETLDKLFQVDSLALKSAVYAQAEKGTTGKEAAVDLVEAVLDLMEAALTADNFAAAEQLVATADKAARKSAKPALAGLVEKRGKEVEDARKAFEAVKPLLTNPGNELEVGKYYCFAKGNYEKGLPLLAKGSDKILKELAERDLASPKDPKQQLELAEAWHTRAEGQKGLAQRQTLRRALHWYVAALPSLEGLTKMRVARQVNELARLFPPTGPRPVVAVEAAAEVRKIDSAHIGGVQGVAVSRDGKLILSCGNDNTVRLWDATTGQKKKDLIGHSQSPFDVAMSADGKWGLSGAHDSTLRLWNLETGQEVRQFPHKNLVRLVRFLPGDRHVMSGCDDGALRIFDRGTGALLKTLTGHTLVVTGLGVSKDGKRAASAGYDKTLRIWDLEKGVESHRFPAPPGVQSVALSPDGKRVVTTSLYDNTLRVQDADTGKELWSYQHAGVVWRVVISPDGRRVYAGCGSRGKWGQNNKGPTFANSEIRVFDLHTGKELRQLPGHEQYVMALAFSADGRVLVSGSHDSTVRLWGAK